MEDNKKVQVERPNLVEEAKKAAERIEAANLRMEHLLDRQERQKIDNIIAGKAEAGTPIIEKSAEEKSIESARDMLKGTGYEDILFPVNEGE